MLYQTVSTLNENIPISGFIYCWLQSCLLCILRSCVFLAVWFKKIGTEKKSFVSFYFFSSSFIPFSFPFVGFPIIIILLATTSTSTPRFLHGSVPTLPSRVCCSLHFFSFSFPLAMSLAQSWNEEGRPPSRSERVGVSREKAIQGKNWRNMVPSEQCFHMR